MQGDIQGGVIVTTGVVAAAGLMVWDMLEVNNRSFDDILSNKPIDHTKMYIAAGVWGATLIFGFVKPFVYNSNRQLASAISNVGIELVSNEQNKKALAIKYTHNF